MRGGGGETDFLQALEQCFVNFKLSNGFYADSHKYQTRRYTDFVQSGFVHFIY